MWDGVALKFDYIRSSNVRGNPVWAAEFQGGPVSTAFHKGRVPSPADMRRWVLTAVGSGITALSFWVTRAEIHSAEMNGFSLLDSVSDTTPRFEEASRIGAALNAHADLFAQPTRAWSKVAILIDENNHQYCNTLGYGHTHQPYSVRGWYRLLWDLGIPVDFIEVSELDEPYVQDYNAIILPFPLSICRGSGRKTCALCQQRRQPHQRGCAGSHQRTRLRQPRRTVARAQRALRRTPVEPDDDSRTGRVSALDAE